MEPLHIRKRTHIEYTSLSLLRSRATVVSLYARRAERSSAGADADADAALIRSSSVCLTYVRDIHRVCKTSLGEIV